MKFSEISQEIININLKWRFDNQPERVEQITKDFVKELRLSLRFEYKMSATDVRKLNDNKVIEEWYKFHSLPENRIYGA